MMPTYKHTFRAALAVALLGAASLIAWNLSAKPAPAPAPALAPAPAPAAAASAPVDFCQIHVCDV